MPNEPHIQALLDKKQMVEYDLKTAREAAKLVAELEAENDRLDAALNALRAPQSPEGRRKIGDAQRQRKRGAAPTPEPPQPVQKEELCGECHAPARDHDGLYFCGHPDCEAKIHPTCGAKHDARWHLAVAK